MDDNKAIELIIAKAHKAGKKIEKTPQATLENLGLDSLDVAEVVMEIEADLKVVIPEAALESEHTLQRLSEYVTAAMRDKEARSLAKS